MRKLIIFLLTMGLMVSVWYKKDELIFSHDAAAQEKSQTTEPDEDEKETPMIIIDNRTAEEFADGHLVDAILLPYDEIEKKIAAVAPDKNAMIKLYCRSGRRSGIAKTALEKMGYKNVENLGSKENAAKILELKITK